MEAAIANLLEPGEKIIVGNAGIWGERVADLSARYGGERRRLGHVARFHEQRGVDSAAVCIRWPTHRLCGPGTGCRKGHHQGNLIMTQSNHGYCDNDM
jgi:hypothetical protein